MFGCCFMSHLSCLFESELTSRAQGYEVYLSLCLCVCVPTPASSVFIKSVSLLTCLHSHCSFHSPSSPQPVPLTACTRSPGSRGQLKETPEYKSLSRSAVLPPIFSMTALLSLFMSKWHSNYNSLMSQIFGMHGTVCSFRLLCISKI